MLLKPKGRLVLVHRVQRLPDVICLAAPMSIWNRKSCA